jgi:hypothetical protein
VAEIIRLKEVNFESWLIEEEKSTARKVSHLERRGSELFFFKLNPIQRRRKL